jgi:uncharacterized protein (DUF1330 family)
MSVYVIASLTIKDAVRFEDYRRMLLPTMAKYGARLVARGGPIVLEGEWPRERLIIATLAAQTHTAFLSGAPNLASGCRAVYDAGGILPFEITPQIDSSSSRRCDLRPISCLETEISFQIV